MELPGYVLLVLYCILVGFCIPIQSIGQSSPIIHQEFGDFGKDWKYGWEYQPLKRIIGHNNSDIHSVSFFSDGRFLNSTVWLVPNETYTSSKVTYGILFDADSNHDTGFNGAEYVLEIRNSKDNSTNQVMQLSELSSSGSIRSMYNKTVGSDFKKGYVHMDLDLSRIGYPPVYLVKYFTNETIEINGTSKTIIDDTAWHSIPSPGIQLIVSPSSITLNPGQRGFVDLQVTSNASIPLSARITYEDTLGINFTSEQFTYGGNKHSRNFELLPNGHGYTRLELRATDDAIPDATYTIPIEGLIFPNEVGFNLPLSKFVGAIDVTIHEFGISDSLTAAKGELGQVWRDNKDIVILIIGAFITPFAAFLISRYTRRRKSKKVI